MITKTINQRIKSLFVNKPDGFNQDYAEISYKIFKNI